MPPKQMITFSNYSSSQAQEELDGYTLVKSTELKNLEPGDNIRYAVESVLKGGGVLKSNKFPDYIAIRNKYKNISWCVQLKEPTLQVWVKKDDTEKKEKVYKLFNEGKLILKDKKYEEMIKIFKLFQDGKLLQKK